MESDPKSWQVVKGKPGGTKKTKGATSTNKPDGNFAVTVKTESAFSAFAAEEDAQEARRVAAQKKDRAERNEALKQKDEREIRAVRKATNLEEALAFLDPEELEQMLKQTVMMCPDRPAVWINDVSVLLGTKLNGFPCDSKDLLLVKKPRDFPCCALNEGIVRLLEKVVSTNEEQTKRFYETAINLLAQSRSNNPCWEYRLLVQVISKKYPHFALRQIEKVNEILRKCAPHATETTTETVLIWCMQQALSADRCPLGEAFDLIYSVLLNAHAVHMNKQVAHASLTIIDAWLSDLEAHRHNGSPLFSTANYFSVFDALFQPKAFEFPKLFAQSEKLREKAERLFARFEELTFYRERKLSSYFVGYLARLRPDPIASMVCAKLFYCLNKDTDCFREWRRLFSTHVVQSNSLLELLRQSQVGDVDGSFVGQFPSESDVLRGLNKKDLHHALTSMRSEARVLLAAAQRRVAKKPKEQPKPTSKRQLERVDEEDALILALEHTIALCDAAIGAISARSSSRSGAESLSRTVACMYLLVLVVVFVLLDFLYARYVLKSRLPQSEMVSHRIANAAWSNRAVQTIVADAGALITRIDAECRKYETLNRLFVLSAQCAASARATATTYATIAWLHAEPHVRPLLTYDYAALANLCVLRMSEISEASHRALLTAFESAKAKMATFSS